MSDDESFVILSSALPPSLENKSLSGNIHSYRDARIESAYLPKEDNINSSYNSKSSVNCFENLENSKSLNTELNDCVDIPHQQMEVLSLQDNSIGNINSSIDRGSITNNQNDNINTADTLASSFYMGKVNADVLKTSIFSQFPSICSMEACAEDVMKLQNFIVEYAELKKTLIDTNAVMRNIQKWKEDINSQHEVEVNNLKIDIARLRNVVLDLERKLADQNEQIKLNEKMREDEHIDLTKTISELNAQISNMRAQIEKLEKHQLSSFEYIPGNGNDSDNIPHYIDRLEHRRVVKNLEQQMSELLAENLEIKDTQKQYIDEITCLKVNLTASEELIKQLRSDITILKAQDIEKSKHFTQYELDREKQKEELLLLKQQLDVYSRDFELERTARQNMAGEKDQLLQDLRALQRKNQQLIEDAQKNWGRGTSSNVSADTSDKSSIIFVEKQEVSNSDTLLYCPVCNTSYKCINSLSNHVELCLNRKN